MSIIREIDCQGVRCICVESESLRVTVAPSVGGKIISLIHRPSGHEFLWHDESQPLKCHSPGTDYDSNFYGAIDELLPNDIPETLCGIDLPDHGELWTSLLDYQITDNDLIVSGKLARSGLEYRRTMTLAEDEPRIVLKYRIKNTFNKPFPLLWKLHAALKIAEGDRIICPAAKARPADLEYSRWTSVEPFSWPHVEGARADIIPPKSEEMDFLYLYNLQEGCMGLECRSTGMHFEYRFDLEKYPVCWLFASYGGFNDSYMAILEPCTTMPMSVNEACENGVTALLQPGETLETEVSIYAGPMRD